MDKSGRRKASDDDADFFNFLSLFPSLFLLEDFFGRKSLSSKPSCWLFDDDGAFRPSFELKANTSFDREEEKDFVIGELILTKLQLLIAIPTD